MILVGSPPVFFNPAKKFLDWIIKQRRVVVDCGAGRGRLGAELLKRGMQSMAYDSWYVENAEYVVLPADVTTDVEFLPCMIIVIARPCRGDWIHDTIEKAIDSNAVVAYVGLPKNFEEDLDPIMDAYKITEVM